VGPQFSPKSFQGVATPRSSGKGIGPSQNCDASNRLRLNDTGDQRTMEAMQCGIPIGRGF